MQETALSLLPLSHSVSMHNYSHWSSNQPFDLGLEVASLAKNHKSDKNLVLVAHAEGVLLGIEAIKKGVLSPGACVFVDTPRGIKSQVQALNMPVLTTTGKLDLVKASRKFLSDLIPGS